MTIDRSDALWTGLRGAGLFFLCKTILLVPAIIHMLRMKETLYGDSEILDALPQIALGMTGLATYVTVYAIAAATLLLVPVRRAIAS